MAPAIVTLIMGIVLGYLAQRSRICFIGGLRDFVLVRDTELLKGVIAFFITAWVAFSIAGAVGLLEWGPPGFDEVSSVPGLAASAARPDAATPNVQVLGLSAVVVGLVAGIALGLFSTLANGCPTRQHVLAAQGVRDSVFYLGGFYIGVIVYNLVTKPLLALVF